ncbi:hypothetical protein ANAPC4_01387 [Anaplasma phagocytophilum]|nr:hypothetical protein ANAPC4_01387 [Anaplasma phagocytophilum]
MIAGFNCELPLGGVEAHHFRKNVAQLNRFTFIHFMYIEFHNPSLRNSVSYTFLHLHHLLVYTNVNS